MQTISNPFHKANPFRVSPYNKFQHPNYNHPKPTSYNPHIYKQHHGPQLNNFLSNNWTFHDDNLNKKNHNLRKEDLPRPDLSNFSINLKTNNKKYNKNSKDYHEQNHNIKDGSRLLQNPFLRKNLFVNRQQVVNQLAMDISVYRNKTTSNYQVNASSHYIYDESPMLNKDRVVSFSQYDNKSKRNSQRENEAPHTKDYKLRESQENSLRYSKTPEMTERGKELPSQDPAKLVFKGKTFYLANLK